MRMFLRPFAVHPGWVVDWYKQVRFGYDNNLGNNQPGFDPEFAGLSVEQKTLGDRLKEAGYVTGLIGKWHLGTRDQFHPINRGFDEFWGYVGGGHHYFKSEENGKGYLVPIESNYKTPQPITYLTDDKGDECVDFIKRHKDEPFFSLCFIQCTTFTFTSD